MSGICPHSWTRPHSWAGLFALAAAVWFGGMAIGYSLAEWIAGMPLDLALTELAAARETGGGEPSARRDESPYHLFAFFLGRNFGVYMCLLAGLLSAGAVTFLVLLGNGVMLGQTIGFALWTGMPARALADLLLPHGVLEVGAFCIAGAVGFQGFALAARRSRQNWQSVKALRLGLVVVFGFCTLAVAAAVEAVVTAELARAHWRS